MEDLSVQKRAGSALSGGYCNSLKQYTANDPDKITLYRGKEVVKKNVISVNAIDDLIELIRKDGNCME